MHPTSPKIFISADVLRELLTRADKDIVNMTNESGSTPLHWGALNGHLEVVKLLIEASADPDVCLVG
jgi:ankyrin repeat protein